MIEPDVSLQLRIKNTSILMLMSSEGKPEQVEVIAGLQHYDLWTAVGRLALLEKTYRTDDISL